jgi:isocitrate lyase
MSTPTTLPDAPSLARDWRDNPRWKGITRPYQAEDVVRLRGSVHVEHSIARLTAEKLWRYLHEKPFVNALGALTGNQAMQQVRAGLDAIYLSGWQVAGDANLAGQMYPDQSLYPADSVPAVVKRINNTLLRADQIQCAEGKGDIDWLKPIVADAEAGFGGVLNAFELMKAMIEAGAAGVHFEDQLASAKKCGHMGGKVLVPTQEAVAKLAAARLAADVCGVPTVLVARTDAEAANLLTSDVDERDRPFLDAAKGRTTEGFYYVRNGIKQAIARALAYAPIADLVWCETGKPDLQEAREFAEGVHRQFPGKMLAYNCSPSFNWKRNLDDATIAKFQRELGAMGYKFQFITLAGFHLINFSMFELAHGYRSAQMSAYVKLQEAEFAAEAHGYTATRHQREVGAGYFDDVTQTIAGGTSSLAALKGSTEERQFEHA